MSTTDTATANIEESLFFPVLDGQAAKATTWAMVSCLVLIAVYLKYCKSFFDENLTPFYHNLIVLTLAIVTVFTVGCVLHMVFIGDKSARELRRELRRRNEEVAKFIAIAHSRVCELQTAVVRNSGLIRPRSLENVGQVRRILHALDQRTEEVRSLLNSRDKIDIIDAHELLGQPLIVVENCLDSLIGADPLPPIEPDEIAPLVEQIFHEIDTDLRRAEMRRKAA